MTTSYFKVAKRTPAHKAQLFLDKVNRERGAIRKDVAKRLNIPAKASWYKTTEGNVQGIEWPGGFQPDPDVWKICNKDPLCWLPRSKLREVREALATVRFMNQHDVMKAFFGLDDVPMVMLPNPGGLGFLMPSLGCQSGTGRCGGTLYLAIHTKILEVEGVKPIEGLIEITTSEYEKATKVQPKGKKKAA